MLTIPTWMHPVALPPCVNFGLRTSPGLSSSVWSSFVIVPPWSELLRCPLGLRSELLLRPRTVASHLCLTFVLLRVLPPWSELLRSPLGLQSELPLAPPLCRHMPPLAWHTLEQIFARCSSVRPLRFRALPISPYKGFVEHSFTNSICGPWSLLSYKPTKDIPNKNAHQRV